MKLGPDLLTLISFLYFRITRMC